MPAPISSDLRERVFAAIERGDSLNKISQEKEVSIRTITRIIHLYKETGSLAPRTLNNGRKPKLDEQQLESISQLLQAEPDITLREVIERLVLPVSVPTIYRTIRFRLQYKFKKNSYSKCTRARGCSKTP